MQCSEDRNLYAQASPEGGFFSRKKERKISASSIYRRRDRNVQTRFRVLETWQRRAVNKHRQRLDDALTVGLSVL